MHCKISWNDAFLRSTFPKTWITKDYRKMREQVLFDVEVSKIPDTQIFCHAYAREKELQKELKTLELQLKTQKMRVLQDAAAYETSTHDVWMDSNNKTLKDKSFELKVKMDYSNCEMDCLSSKKEVLANLHRDEADIIRGTQTAPTSSYLMNCPAENCKGYITGSWDCGICRGKVCSHCREVFQEKHVCNKDIVNSVNRVKDESKPCPKCHVPIFKISGCDQMWCTLCKTGFSWNTGYIERDIHNPHYYQWMRSQGNPLPGIGVPVLVDINCNLIISPENHYLVINKIRDRTKKEAEKELLFRLVRLLTHMNQVELGGLSYQRLVPSDPNRIVRLQYMMGDMTKKEFCSFLQRKDKELVQHSEYTNVIHTFVNVTDELVKGYLFKHKNFKDLTEELEQIRAFTNQGLETLAIQFVKKPKHIDTDFEEIK